MWFALFALSACDGITLFGPAGRSGGDDALQDAACPSGSFCDPIPLGSFPAVVTGDTRTAPSDAVDRYGCASGTNESGGEYVYVVHLARPGRLSAAIDELPGDGVDVDVHLLDGTDPLADCLARDHVGVEADLPAGTYWIAVDTWTTGAGVPQAGPFTLTVDVQTDIWRPLPGTSWHWQLSGAVDPAVDADAVDLDLADTPDATLQALRSRGTRAICHFSAGTREDWRPDAGDLPPEALGTAREGWTGVRWLDVRHPAVRDVLAARLDQAAARGCDAVEPDDIDGWQHPTGFPLTAADAVDLAGWLADEAHGRGLSMGLRNAVELVPELVDRVDFAVNDGCLASATCAELQPFVLRGKAVFHAEMVDDPSQGAAALEEVCGAPGTTGFSSLVKTWDLGAWGLACPTAPSEQALHDALLALTASCSRVPGTSDFREDAGGARTIPVCQLPGAIWWTADMDIDCDGGQQASCTVDPWYQSTTAAVDSQGDYLDANVLPFVVVPRASNGFTYGSHGLAMGSAVAVLHDGQIRFGVVGDVGPAGVIGEASWAMADALGIPTSPISGGVASGVTYIHFTGTAARVSPIEDTVRAHDLGLQQALELLAEASP